jgi:pyruvate/2-oxoglutarate dehydrogenase complex dihydrolipoamide dehydrogenase (E3) component
MAEQHDLVLIGMGSGGLVASEFATTIGLKPVVVERGRVGGDCLWTGCVPSKALLASAKVAHHMRTANDYGIASVEPEIDAAKVWERIRAVQERIATTDDSPERYEQMGVEIVNGHGRLTGPTTVEADGRVLESKHILLCTGSRPFEPPIEGLREAGFVTSESLFELTQPPKSFVMIGGGPISVEMAQGMNRLGIGVSLLQKGPRILNRDEPDLSELVTQKLRDEGVDLCLNVDTQKVTVENGMKVVHGTENGEPKRWEGEEILVGAGRTPNVDGLGLEDLGVKVGRRGVETDGRLRTSVPSIYAAGDVAGRFLFTHSAGYESVAAVRDMFFPGKAKVTDFVPWCTFTDPELAHAGLTTAEAIERHGEDDVEVYRMDLEHSDRARADGTDEGAIICVTAKEKLVGAHIAAASAGEMIHELALAIREEMKFRDLAGLIHVYPTVTTSIGMLAAEAAFDRAKRLRWLVRK